MTLDCLRTIVETLDGSLALEIIAVDDGSSEPVAGALAELAGVTVLRNGVNQGFFTVVQSRRFDRPRDVRCFSE